MNNNQTRMEARIEKPRMMIKIITRRESSLAATIVSTLQLEYSYLTFPETRTGKVQVPKFCCFPSRCLIGRPLPPTNSTVPFVIILCEMYILCCAINHCHIVPGPTRMKHKIVNFIHPPTTEYSLGTDCH